MRVDTCTRNAQSMYVYELVMSYKSANDAACVCRKPAQTTAYTDIGGYARARVRSDFTANFANYTAELGLAAIFRTTLIGA